MVSLEWSGSVGRSSNPPRRRGRVITQTSWSFLVVGIGLLCAGVWQWARTRAFLDQAVSVQGSVVAIEGEHQPVVQYHDLDGGEHEVRGDIGSDLARFEVGEDVEVLYDPEDPGDARLGTFAELWFAVAMLGGLGGAFGLMGGGIIGTRAVWRRRAAVVRRTGLQVQARVVSVERNAYLTVNDRSPWRIVCEWKDPSTGRTHLLRSRNLWFYPAPFLQGGELTAFVDRRNPARHVVDVEAISRRWEAARAAAEAAEAAADDRELR